MLLFASCDKFLDVDPKTQVDAEKMFETEHGFKDALSECYKKMGSDDSYGNYLSRDVIEILAQNLEPNSSNNNIKLMDLDFTIDDAKDFALKVFKSQYKIIAQINDVLYYIDAKRDVISTDVLRNTIKGEALALRAFIHFDILRMFGQMPKNPTMNVSLPYATKVSKEDAPMLTYDAFTAQIIADLDEAEALLKDNDPAITMGLDDKNYKESFLTYRKFRMNIYAVKALKARYYRYIGDAAKASECAKDVITTLVNGSPLFKFTLSEDIAEQYYNLPNESIFLLSDTDYKQNLRPVDGFYISKTNLDKMFVGNLSDDIRYLRLWEENNKGDMESKKFLDTKDIENLYEEEKVTKFLIIPMIRLAEMYLIVAESDSDLTIANDYYSKFVQSRGIITPNVIDASNRMSLIETEYRREFPMEGVMYYFYKRNFYKKMMFGIGDELTDKNYIMPTPDVELARD